MPQLGYGVYQTPPEDTERCVLDAIEAGYRLIDTAQAYGNETGVGSAVRKCGVPRGELFLTTKVWITNAIHTYAGVQLHMECADIMKKQGYSEPTGKAKITSAYNLPCRYVLHTVGPIIYGPLTLLLCD